MEKMSYEDQKALILGMADSALLAVGRIHVRSVVNSDGRGHHLEDADISARGIRSTLRYIFPKGSSNALLKFVEASYQVGANPLPHLRKILGYKADVRYLIDDGRTFYPDEDHLFWVVSMDSETGGLVGIYAMIPNGRCSVAWSLSEIEATAYPE